MLAVTLLLVGHLLLTEVVAFALYTKMDEILKYLKNHDNKKE